MRLPSAEISTLVGKVYRHGLAAFNRMPRLFAVTVFVPTILAILYYGLIAADVFVSEAKFVVRSPQREPASGLGDFMERVGFTTSQDDAYSVRDFMLSRDALRELDEAFDFRALYGYPRGDFLTRFPGLDFDDSFEALHEYFQGRVEVNIDSVSSITTITVNAFNADHAILINNRLLQMAENLVNQLNERGRQDLMKFAAEEVRLAERKAKRAALAVREFRNLKGVFDPQQQSTFDLGQISRLQDELINTRTQLAEVLRLARYNPKVGALRDRIRALEAEISAASSKVAGEGGSLSDKYAEYARLALEQEFADKQLETALASLEQARNEAQRQQLYLERIVQPSKPDVAVLPERLQAVVVVFMVGVVTWGLLSMLSAGIREHQD